jgi:hypothetical protein
VSILEELRLLVAKFSDNVGLVLDQAHRGHLKEYIVHGVWSV